MRAKPLSPYSRSSPSESKDAARSTQPCEDRAAMVSKTSAPETKFTKTIAAACALDATGGDRWEAQFALGDALVMECGPPGPDGVNNGALNKAAKVIGE